MHSCYHVVAVKYVHYVPKSIHNINNTKIDLQKHPICLTDSDHDYILGEIEHRNKIELERNLRDDGDEEQFLLILSHLLISSIELFYIFFPQYLYACDISYYLIISFIFNLYLLISIFYSLVSNI